MLQPILRLQINEDSEKLSNLSAETLYRPLIPKHYFSRGSLDFAQFRQRPTPQPRPLVACQLFNVYGIPALGCILTSVCPMPTWGSSICHHRPSSGPELGGSSSILQLKPHPFISPPGLQMIGTSERNYPRRKAIMETRSLQGWRGQSTRVDESLGISMTLSHVLLEGSKPRNKDSVTVTVELNEGRWQRPGKHDAESTGTGLQALLYLKWLL